MSTTVPEAKSKEVASGTRRLCRMYGIDPGDYCSDDGDVSARGLCRRHYQREYYRTLTPERMERVKNQRREYHKARYGDPEIRARQRAIEKTQDRERSTSPESMAEYRAKRRVRHVKRMFNLTESAHRALIAGGPFGPARCWACGIDEPGGSGGFHVDHDRLCCEGNTSCGKCIRGLLCRKCNMSNGQTGTMAGLAQWTEYMITAQKMAQRIIRETTEN